MQLNYIHGVFYIEYLILGCGVPARPINLLLKTHAGTQISLISNESPEIADVTFDKQRCTVKYVFYNLKREQ